MHGWVRSIDYAGENPPAEYPNGSEPFRPPMRLISKDKFQGEFDNPVAVERRRYLATGCLIDIRAGRPEHRMVEQVEDLAAEFKSFRFSHRNLLAELPLMLPEKACLIGLGARRETQ
jgi:hypothetical protein